MMKRRYNKLKLFRAVKYSVFRYKNLYDYELSYKDISATSEDVLYLVKSYNNLTYVSRVDEEGYQVLKLTEKAEKMLKALEENEKYYIVSYKIDITDYTQPYLYVKDVDLNKIKRLYNELLTDDINQAKVFDTYSEMYIHLDLANLNYPSHYRVNEFASKTVLNDFITKKLSKAK